MIFFLNFKKCNYIFCIGHYVKLLYTKFLSVEHQNCCKK
ncbi:unnamed protein product [Brassica oleracea var. botrytis]